MVLSMFSFRMLSADSQEAVERWETWRDTGRHGETRGEQRVCNEDEEHARPLLMCFPWVPPVLFGLDLENMPLAVHSQVHPGA
jgi:hypothetical protein